MPYHSGSVVEFPQIGKPVTSKRESKHQTQVDIPITYNGMIFNEGLRLDVLLEELMICELTDKRVSFLVNFNRPLIKNGIKRIIP